MEPRIQYAKTADGVSIAYAAWGEGPSNVVRELSAGKGFLFADIGEVVPKGFEDPVRLHEVRWRP